MVDFRYHLVSIVAVFLALAIGIVVGTTALNGPVLNDLNRRVADLTGDKRGLESDLRSAEQRTADQEQAVRLLAPVVASGRLDGQRVVLVSTPDAPARLREDLLPLLNEAGAELGASVRLQPALLAPASNQLLEDLVARVAVAGADLPEGEPVDRAVAQLAQVLVRRPGVAAPSGDTIRRVLSAYQGEDLLTVQGSTDPPGTLAIVFTGPPPSTPPTVETGEAAAAAARAVVGLARALDSRGSGAVVAGPIAAADDRGTLQVLRDDNAASDRVSSVDSADTPSGRLALVLALQEQVAGGSGAYGSGRGADAPVPQPTP